MRMTATSTYSRSSVARLNGSTNDGSNDMTKTTAAQRLIDLHVKIDAASTALEEQRGHHARLVAEGDDAAADKVTAGIRDASAQVETLRDRVPILERLAAEEADAEREAQAAELTAKADAIRADMAEHYVKAAKAARALRAAREAINEGAVFEWYQVARKAKELGGKPDLEEIPHTGELRGTLAVSSRELSSIAEAWLQQAYQVRQA